MIKVDISGVKLISGYSPAELDIIKDELTFPNPQFNSAQRHSRFGTGSIPPYINYYTSGKAGLIVPRGYPIPFQHKVVSDTRRVNLGVRYPKLHIKLRDTQKEAVDHFLHYYKNSNDEHGVIILPTGKGKSILGLYLARKFQQRALIVVHKDDLVTGWTKDAKVVFGLKPKQVGLIKGKDFRLGSQVTVTTVQTLSKLPPDKIRQLHDYFGMIIVDEFHHSVAKIYELVNYFPARFKIGLTATAMRNDGLVDVLYLHFGKLVYEFKETVDDEDILPVQVKIRNTNIEWKWNPPKEEWKYNHAQGCLVPPKVKISDIRKGISFNRKFNTMLAKDVISEYKRKKSCIIFTHEKDHCRIIEDEIIRLGVPAKQVQLYYGDTPKNEKDAIMKRAENKEVLITIATYSIATEGTNVKSWERGFLASTLANEKDTIQAIGRCRRTKTGKSDCIIYDYRFPKVTGAKNHGKIRDKVYKERNFSVEGKETKDRKKTGRGWGVFR